MSSIVITGAGVVTRVADSPARLHQALCAGAGAVEPVAAFASAGLACTLAGVVDAASFRAELAGRPTAGLDKTGQLAIVAAQRALAASGVDARTAAEMGLVLGTMFSSAHTIGEFDRRAQASGPEFASPLDFANTVLNAAAGQAAIRLGLHGVNSTIAGGHAAGLQAIAYAAQLVSGGHAAALLAGGVEEVGLETYVGFCRAGLMCGTNGRPGHVAVPFDVDRTGFAVGEAGALVVIEHATAAARRGCRARAEIAGFAAATDPDAIDHGVCDRATIAAVIDLALARAGAEADEVDAISAAANGSFAGDEEEAAALAAVFGARTHPPAVTAIKSAIGETLGASGALQVIAMAEAMADSRLPGIRGLRTAAGPIAPWISASTRALSIRTALVTSVSPEGGCCALVLRAPGLAG